MNFIERLAEALEAPDNDNDEFTTPLEYGTILRKIEHLYIDIKDSKH